MVEGGGSMMLLRDEMLDDLIRQSRELLQRMSKAPSTGAEALILADKYKQCDRRIREIKKKGATAAFRKEVYV